MRRSRPQNLYCCLALHYCSLLVAVSAFVCSSEQSLSFRGLHSTSHSSDDGISRVDASESSFWYSVVRKGPLETNDVKIPHEPLDADGPLPPGAYQVLGKNEYEAVPTCRLTISMADDKREPDLSRIHQCIDCGLSTFQFNRPEIYGTLRANTPASVLRSCHFVVPYIVPQTMMEPSMVRETVLQALQDTGGDCIDTLQVKYTKGSPYHLDVLDCLQEMQRDGLIRSIASRDFTPQLLREATKICSVDSNQIVCNVLDPTHYTKELQFACGDLQVPLVMSSPLASGLLTNRYLDKKHMEPWKWTSTERRNFENLVTPWAKKKEIEENVWQAFQREMMDVLGDVALKHRASVASVALRWAMQLEHVASVAVSCSLGKDDNDDRPFDGPPRLRQVFTFELDDEDTRRLWDASGEAKLIEEFQFDELDLDDTEQRDSGLFLPDMSNQKLWL